MSNAPTDSAAERVIRANDPRRIMSEMTGISTPLSTPPAVAEGGDQGCRAVPCQERPAEQGLALGGCARDAIEFALACLDEEESANRIEAGNRQPGSVSRRKYETRAATAKAHALALQDLLSPDYWTDRAAKPATPEPSSTGRLDTPNSPALLTPGQSA